MFHKFRTHSRYSLKSCVTSFTSVPSLEYIHRLQDFDHILFCVYCLSHLCECVPSLDYLEGMDCIYQYSLVGWAVPTNHSGPMSLNSISLQPQSTGYNPLSTYSLKDDNSQSFGE